MTTISAKVIKDSVSREGHRLTTMELVYPRFIHSEFMTHRAFSRNASSSRAIPVERQIRMIEENPATPLYWGRNQPGMQAGEELEGDELWHAQRTWDDARKDAVKHAKLLHSYGAHKQIVNRILEPYAHIKVLVSATEWDNFFELRTHSDAEPHIQELADEMQRVRNESTPTLLKFKEWHLPYIVQEDYFSAMGMSVEKVQTAMAQSMTHFNNLLLGRAIQISAARCARVSYANHDGTPPNIEADLALYSRLVGSVPLHASPCEHQATPDHKELDEDSVWHKEAWRMPLHHGNFQGWVQHRKVLEYEDDPVKL